MELLLVLLFFQLGVQLGCFNEILLKDNGFYSHPGPFLLSLSSVWVEGRDEPDPSAHVDWHPKVTVAQSPALNQKSLSESLADRISCVYCPGTSDRARGNSLKLH